ncbi:MAG: SIMPL domain-containing protein [Chloroflexota bacterium]
MSKRTVKLFTACAASLLLVGAGVAGHAMARGNASPARAASTSHIITVQGHGDVSVAPDQASITLGVQTRATDAQEALSKNADKMNAVIAAVKGQGVTGDHIQTSDLNLYYDSQSNVYVAEHQITVKLGDVSKVGSVLDAAVGAGANTSWGVSFGLSDESAAKAQALKNAVSNARAHADSLAQALGVSVTGVGSIQESGATFTPPVPYAAAPSAASTTPVQPGQLTVSGDVTVVYTFG